MACVQLDTRAGDTRLLITRRQLTGGTAARGISTHTHTVGGVPACRAPNPPQQQPIA